MNKAINEYHELVTEHELSKLRTFVLAGDRVSPLMTNTKLPDILPDSHISTKEGFVSKVDSFQFIKPYHMQIDISNMTRQQRTTLMIILLSIGSVIISDVL
ncbi:hypothetical protein AVEN_136756-1 [Araneus ventricosus]|uniref:Uncharacterized protein n=1 Tax=Araneus ventricosus TaxID=182803 RepID=A0A4Y2VE48_ARAVE|nr:hypothetical protein AVEN_136756-1 [Araneus ventricosus]